MGFKMLEDFYGKELILDLHNCNPSKFNRKDIENYFIELCDLIDMEREDLHFWDYEDVPQEEIPTEPHLVGTSAIQFIKTSNITMHTLDIMKAIYLNIFSCKDFDAEEAKEFTEKWFEGETASFKVIKRHKKPKVEITTQKNHAFLWINDYLWMWDIPVERRYQKQIASGASGDVLVAGYGLGMVQEYLMKNPNVTSVVTVEMIPEVIDECGRFYGKIHGKTEIGDFFDLTEDKKFDCVIGDVWEEILPEFLDDYKKLKTKALRLLKKDGKYFGWGQEYFEYLISQEEAPCLLVKNTGNV